MIAPPIEFVWHEIDWQKLPEERVLVWGVRGFFGFGSLWLEDNVDVTKLDGTPVAPEYFYTESGEEDHIPWDGHRPLEDPSCITHWAYADGSSA